MKLLIIDNYDSFTFNLYQLAAEVFESLPVVWPNDRPFKDVLEGDFDAILISPGPGTPVKDSDFGISKDIIQKLNLPTFGVCLGHQGICHLFGGSVTLAPVPMHGREYAMLHNGRGLFAGIPSPFTAVRYHSLIAREPLPSCLERTAWTEDGLVMGVAHKTKPVWGVQFHPESICSDFGFEIMRNFHRMSAEFHAASGNQGSRFLPSAAVVRPQINNPAVPIAAAKQRRVFAKRKVLEQNAQEIFEKLFLPKPYAFWLDSSLTREPDARFSFLGGYASDEAECVRYYAHNRRLTVRRGGVEELSADDLFPFLKKNILNRPVAEHRLPFDFDGGFVGYFGYELKAVCGAQAAHRSAHPDCLGLIAQRFIAIDHVERELYLVYVGEDTEELEAEQWFDEIAAALAASAPEAPAVPKAAETIQFVPVQSEHQYLDNIQRSQLAIRHGETYEVCLTNQLVASTSVDPFEYYKALRSRNPAPYASFLKFPEVTVASSSPERFLKIDGSGAVETKPIKGTVRRGANPEEDQFLKVSLAQDEKSRSENLMIVDLLRNDLGRVCSVGSVHVPKLMHVETYATVHQLVTTIRGNLDSEQTSVDCLQSAFPGGSMTGAPKLRTLDIIDGLENCARGIYSGSIGFCSFGGCMDLNIVIRTAVFSRNTVTIGVGGAIIALSDPQEEWAEILLKAKALLTAFQSLNKNVLLMNRPVETYGKTLDLSKRAG